MATADATDSVHSNQTAPVILPANSVPNQDPLAAPLIAPRTVQQIISPQAVQPRQQTNIFSHTDPIYQAFTVPNSTSATFNFRIINNSDQFIVAIPDTSVFVNVTDISQINEQNQWPDFAVGAIGMPVYINVSDWFRSGDGQGQYARITCRNNSGADVPVIVVVRWRILTQPQPGQFGGSASAPQ